MPKQAATGASSSTKPAGKKRARPVSSRTSAAKSAVVSAREPSHTEIAEHAYALFAARGFREGDPVHDWVTAERALRSAG